LVCGCASRSGPEEVVVELAEALPHVNETNQRAADDRSGGWATGAGTAASDSPAVFLRLGDAWGSVKREQATAENNFLTTVS
jgi:hypothetical protein